MLLARHPHLLAAAAADDPVTNFLARERQFARSLDSRGERRRARSRWAHRPSRIPPDVPAPQPLRVRRRVRVRRRAGSTGPSSG